MAAGRWRLKVLLDHISNINHVVFNYTLKNRFKLEEFRVLSAVEPTENVYAVLSL